MLRHLLAPLALSLLSLTSASDQYCTGQLVWNNTAPACIATCTAHFFPTKDLCPLKTIGRCVCPQGMVKLDDTQDLCVTPDSEACQNSSTKYIEDISSQFVFAKEPEDVSTTEGKSVTLTCLVSNRYTIQYVWYKMSKLPQGDVTGDTNLYMTGTSELVFGNVKSADAGYYQCKAIESKEYLMLSGVGHLQVKHFTTGALSVSEERVVVHEPLAELKCATIDAFPMPTITWLYNDQEISYSGSHYFVNRNPSSPSFGNLYITNVGNAHAGVYKCKGRVLDKDIDVSADLAKRTIIISGSQNTVSALPSTLDTANYDTRVVLGQTGSMYCAGYGFPIPTITWQKVKLVGEIQTDITGCTETACIQENGRKIIIYNMKAEQIGDYQCKVTNSYGSVTKILSISEAPKSYDVKFLAMSKPVTIEPNRYVSFTLTCIVDTTYNNEIYMGWYQNTLGISGKGNRIQTKNIINDGQRAQMLIFNYPTNDDHGIFQCLAYNAKQYKQSTTDVLISREGVSNNTATGDFATEMYDPSSAKEYRYFVTPATPAVAQAACKTWNADANLATILDYSENNQVFELIMTNLNTTTNVTKAWIGLTDETKEGYWMWLSKEVSNKFAFWYVNNPDNGRGNEDYAYMDVALSGHWIDANASLELPYVCKFYNGTCKDLENASDNTFDFKSYTKTKTAGKVSIYDTALIKCGKEEAKLTCAPSGKWVLSSDSVCESLEAVKGSGVGQTMQLTLLISLLMFILLR